MRLWPAFLTCPLLAGCLGFGYPDLSRTPPVAVPTDGVRAFRVVSAMTMSGPIMTGPIQCNGWVEEIPIVNGTVRPQHDACFSYYYLIFPFNGSRSRGLKVVLYRPGYEIVEVPARPWWQQPGGVTEKVAWKEAPDLPAQKAAVDRIIAGFQLAVPSKEVLQFAAQEYARLADSPLAAVPEMAATREELRKLARECLDRAEKRNP
ncbi:MAG TPA: hypothetical protein VFA26_22835 [Gemmataceae bacterium]|nr:hypothetical protein [Gemmataceae bacterium]